MTAVMVSLAAVERDKALNSLDSFIVRYGTARDIKSKNSCNCASCEEPLDDKMVVDGEEEVKRSTARYIRLDFATLLGHSAVGLRLVFDLFVGNRSSIS